MPGWVLTWKRYGARFAHIRRESESLADYFSATKPHFTPEGAERKAKLIYRQYELVTCAAL
jgi:hypothetical protein